MAKKDQPKTSQPKLNYQEPSPPRVILAALEPEPAIRSNPERSDHRGAWDHPEKPSEAPAGAAEPPAARVVAPTPQANLTGLGAAGQAMSGAGVASHPTLGPGSGVIATGAGQAPTAATSGPLS
jgi:hypothetical protein